MEFTNKTIIVTGAGSGMGRSMSLMFAAQGANVIGSDVNETRLSELENEIRANKGTVSILKSNVADEKDAAAMIEFAVKTYGRIDVLINNAGVLDDFMPVADTTTEVWNRVMGVNINGPFYTCRSAVQVMLKQGKGNIINVASIGGFCGARAGVAYTSSKHALIGLTKNIGYMYAQQGIRCNAIAPGAVNTNIGVGMHPDPFGYQRMQTGMQTIPRAADPTEIAELAVFLASDRSAFINGAVVTADGGWTAY